MRWDFTETNREHDYRTSGFSPTVANPATVFGGAALPGALSPEGFGHTGDCECYFSPKYPYALGPRLGVAYSADPKTVFRGGFGITYGAPPVFNYAGSNFNVVSVGINNVPFSHPTYFTPVTTLTSGFQYNPAAITDSSRNPAYGWYFGAPEDMNREIVKWNSAYGDRGLAISEYGGGAKISDHKQNLVSCDVKPAESFQPEEWQALVHEGNYRAIRNHPEVWGSFLWLSFDSGGMALPNGTFRGGNIKGLVTQDRAVKKDAYYFYQASWTTKPMLYLTSRRQI